MDENYKRKRTENRLRQRLEELYKARNEIDDTKTWSLRDRALRKGRVDFWTVLAEQEAIDAQIENIERKLFVRRD